MQIKRRFARERKYSMDGGIFSTNGLLIGIFVRYLDKLVDELAKGRKMEKILRIA
jgi:hypothetical protein